MWLTTSSNGSPTWPHAICSGLPHLPVSNLGWSTLGYLKLLFGTSKSTATKHNLAIFVQFTATSSSDETYIPHKIGSLYALQRHPKRKRRKVKVGMQITTGSRRSGRVHCRVRHRRGASLAPVLVRLHLTLSSCKMYVESSRLREK